MKYYYLFMKYIFFILLLFFVRWIVAQSLISDDMTIIPKSFPVGKSSYAQSLKKKVRGSITKIAMQNDD